MILLLSLYNRVTSGLVIIAKNKKTAALVSKEIRENSTHKIYLARVKGKFASSLTHLIQLEDKDLFASTESDEIKNSLEDVLETTRSEGGDKLHNSKLTSKKRNREDKKLRQHESLRGSDNDPALISSELQPSSPKRSKNEILDSSVSFNPLETNIPPCNPPSDSVSVPCNRLSEAASLSERDKGEGEHIGYGWRPSSESDVLSSCVGTGAVGVISNNPDLVVRCPVGVSDFKEGNGFFFHHILYFLFTAIPFNLILHLLRSMCVCLSVCPPVCLFVRLFAWSRNT